MTNDEAGDRQIIVFATNIDEAEYIAKKVFDTSFVSVKPISLTANPQVFEI